MDAGYPIRTAAKLAGLPLETLRAWERRYDVVQPQRDARGRLYSDKDVRKLRLLRQLVDAGYAIGRVADRPVEELTALAREIEEGAAAVAPAVAGPGVQAILGAFAGFDVRGAERELGRLLTLLGPRDFVFLVALPVMRTVGDAWAKGRLNVAQEHFASAALRNALGTLMRLHVPEQARTRVVLATPPGEQHEFGVLGAAMLAAGAGIAPLYLGPNLPAEDILSATRGFGASFVALALTGATDPQPGLEAIRQVAHDLPANTELWVGGARSPALAERIVGAGGRFLGSLEEFELRLAARD